MTPIQIEVLYYEKWAFIDRFHKDNIEKGSQK